MVSTPGVFNGNSQMSHSPSVTVKNPCAGKSLRQFTEFLDFKKKTSGRRLYAVKSERKEIRTDRML